MEMTEVLKKKSDLHITRKVFHCLGILVIVFVYVRLTHVEALKAASILAISAILTDFFRLRYSGVNRIVIKALGPVMRESEKNAISGSTALMIGTLTIIYLFPRNIVTLALLFLAVGDPLASYVGIKYGRDKLLNNKSLQGAVGAFFACTLISLVFYYSKNLMLDRILIVSLLSGLLGAFSELISLGKLDDNFTFPVLSSCFLYILFFLFGGS